MWPAPRTVANVRPSHRRINPPICWFFLFISYIQLVYSCVSGRSNEAANSWTPLNFLDFIWVKDQLKSVWCKILEMILSYEITSHINITSIKKNSSFWNISPKPIQKIFWIQNSGSTVAHLNYSLIDLVRFWYLLNIVFEHNTQLPSGVFVTWIAFWTSGLFIKSRISLSLVQEGVSLSFLLANILSLTLLGKLSIKNDLKCCIDPEDSQSRFCYHQDFQF